MNIKELEKLRVVWDKDNDCWCIADSNTCLISDIDIAYELDISSEKYFKILTDNGGYYLDEEYNILGFKTEEIAEQCLEAIKNYKEDDIIENTNENLHKILFIKYTFKLLANNKIFDETFSLEEIENADGGFIKYIKKKYGKSITIINREFYIMEGELYAK